MARAGRASRLRRRDLGVLRHRQLEDGQAARGLAVEGEGEDIVVTAYKKPISTLRRGLPSVDLDTLESRTSQYERSDVTALPAAGVIAEAMVALELADALLVKLGGDSIQELLAHWNASRDLQESWPPRP